MVGMGNGDLLGAKGRSAGGSSTYQSVFFPRGKCRGSDLEEDVLDVANIVQAEAQFALANTNYFAACCVKHDFPPCKHAIYFTSLFSPGTRSSRSGGWYRSGVVFRKLIRIWACTWSTLYFMLIYCLEKGGNHYLSSECLHSGRGCLVWRRVFFYL